MDMLKNIPLFSCLEDPEIEFLEKVMKKKSFPKNSIIFSEGEDSDSVYIIKKGKVKAIVADENGKEITLNIHGPGEYFGEMSFIDGEPRSATIITKEPAEFMMIMRDDFKKVLSSNPDMAFNMLKGVTHLLRQATHKIENLAFLDVYGRLCNVLKQYAKPKGEKLVVEEKLTHQELANIVGSSREMISRILKELVDGGYLAIDKKQITIQKKLPSSF